MWSETLPSICLRALVWPVLGVSILFAEGASAQTTQGVHDVVTTTFTATCKDPDDSSKPLDIAKISDDIIALRQGTELAWTKTEFYRIAKGASKDPTKVDAIDKNQAYIFHVDHWTPAPAHSLVSSDWYVYKSSGPTKLKPSGFTAAGDQLLYGLKRALIVGVEIFDEGGKSGAVKITYKTSVTQGTPANAQALGQLLSALLGLASKSTLFESPDGCTVLTAASFQEGTAHLPFDLNVAMSANDTTKPKPTGPSNNSTPNASAGVADCPDLSTGSTCSLSRKFTGEDREWWDVSIGVTIPGVRETKYSIVNNALSSSVKTHTDMYGMFDIYPSAYWLTKDSPAPHLVVGLPLTSQTFYRPFFGISENLTGWNGLQKKLALPVGLNFFAGVVYMKTSQVVGAPTTAAQLASDTRYLRVVKPLFGIEVPVAALVSKIGKSASKNTNSNTSGNAGSKSSGT
jgi:hypothetical protein